MAAMVALSRISHTGWSGLLSFIDVLPAGLRTSVHPENAPVAILIPVVAFYSGRMDIAPAAAQGHGCGLWLSRRRIRSVTRFRVTTRHREAGAVPSGGGRPGGRARRPGLTRHCGSRCA